MSDSTFDIHDGNNQIAPNATHLNQIYFGDQFARTLLGCQDTPPTLVVLGAGADTTMGLPTSANLIPCIVEYLETEEGRAIDAILRKAIGHVRFHFDKFVSNAIERLAKDLDRELVTICHDISEELEQNTSLDEHQRKMGALIVRLFHKVIDIKMGATIDPETETLITEVFDTVVRDDTIIDFSHLNYTDTFKGIIIEILQKSMHESSNPILRHVYRNILDIEQLLSQYFYGFYTSRTSQVRDYLYISWILWAYLVSQEQRIHQESCKESTSAPSAPGLYAQLTGADIQLLTFNYTTFARHASSTALYFHGSLMEYVDVENKNDLQIDDLTTLDLVDFFQSRLAQEISLGPGHRAIPIPSFLPPLKLKPVISKRYIDIWYRASQLMLRAGQIVVIGYSFTSADAYFCDMLRENRDARIVVIDSNIDLVSRNLCHILQLHPDRYTRQVISGHEHRIYDNRLTIIGADISDLDMQTMLDTLSVR